MKRNSHVLVTLACLWVSLAQLSAASNMDSESTGQNEQERVICIEFPDLAPTLVSLMSGKSMPAKLTAILPQNYTREKNYPLLVFLEGGDGGRGDNTRRAEVLAQGREFIVVNMPLFKAQVDSSERHQGVLMAMDDFEILQENFGIMLDELEKRIPNIQREGSALGGFSNGAHATGILLAGADDRVVPRFEQFYFIEGGFGPLSANCLQKAAFRSRRLLLLYGDQPGENGGPTVNSDLAQVVVKNAKRNGLKHVTAIPMIGHGHEQPPEYLDIVARWLAEENSQ